MSRPFEHLTGITYGASYAVSRWLFLRALGVVYLIAFVSFWVQADGLIGPEGILPVGDLLDAIARRFGSEGILLAPSVLWLGTGTTALNLLCGFGVVAALMLVLDIAPALTCLAAWSLYLSLVSVGRDFLAFQWDVLLLEAGLLSVLLAPRHLRPRPRHRVAPEALPLVLLWLLLFRLTFESGVVKLSSGDPTWRDLSALDYHFFTQPLPTWTAWYAHYLPEWFKRLSVLGMFVLELAIPPLIFCGRAPRRIAFAGIVLLQLLIFATGNYTFFNLLTIALALLLIEDREWRKALPARVLPSQGSDGAAESGRATRTALAAIGLPLLVLGLVSGYGTVVAKGAVPKPFQPVFRVLGPFHVVNSYGLFRIMTTERREIAVEGSLDGMTWRAYEFRAKPGDPGRRPRFVEPHQPRLDWQMWFAALGRFDTTPWFQAFLARLLQGSPSVTALLGTNPFPDRPPTYVRALFYDYRFSTPEEHTRDRTWWTRRLLGEYSPVLSLVTPR